MFRSATDHHQGANFFLVKISELNMWVFIRGDRLLIEMCQSTFKFFNVWHFKLMFYYIQVHLLDHCTLLLSIFNIYYNTFWPVRPSSCSTQYKTLVKLIATLIIKILFVTDGLLWQNLGIVQKKIKIGIEV
jgi:hypothetical protein